MRLSVVLPLLLAAPLVAAANPLSKPQQRQLRKISRMEKVELDGYEALGGRGEVNAFGTSGRGKSKVVRSVRTQTSWLRTEIGDRETIARNGKVVVHEFKITDPKKLTRLGERLVRAGLLRRSDLRRGDILSYTIPKGSPMMEIQVERWDGPRDDVDSDVDTISSVKIPVARDRRPADIRPTQGPKSQAP